VEIGGRRVPLSSELFAIAADAHLVLGEISEGEYTVETPDSGGKDRLSAERRLARTVCADPKEIGSEGVIEIARQARSRQERLLTDGIRRLAERHALDLVVAAGIGEGLIDVEARALDLECVRLSERYGSKVSNVFPAYAVARLLEMELSG